MAFWNTSNIQRQAAYSFEVEFGTGDNATVWQAKSVQLPSYEQEIIQDLIEGQILKSKGPLTWQPVVIELYDIAPSNSAASLLEPEGDDFQTQASTSFMAYATAANLIKKVKDRDSGRVISDPFMRTENYKRDVGNSWYQNPATLGGQKGLIGGIRIRKIYLNEGLDRGVEEWHLVQPMITGLNFGTLDASSEETVVISLTFDYQSVN